MFLPRFSIALIIFNFIQLISSVDRNNFKTCQQSSFCRRCRAVEPGKSPYDLLLNTLQIDDSSLSAQIINKNNNVLFKFELFTLEDATVRFKISELNPLRNRYEPLVALDGEPKNQKLELLEKNNEFVIIKSGNNKFKINASPFKLDAYSGDTLVITANAKGLMKFEHYRPKPPSQEESDAAAANAENAETTQAPPTPSLNDDADSDPGSWEENFKSHHDSKPYGPAAVALDFTFHGAQHAYGIPEHGDSFALKNTKGTEPYRLYNLDVFEYELDNGMALYGSIPVLVTHGLKHTTGVFWLNSAETWVDILGSGGSNMVSSIVNFVSGANEPPQVDAHFMSETGIMDVFLMLGPRPMDFFRQYTHLTGAAPLPQMFSLGYHQSRWNYVDQDDVNNVHHKFDEHDIPLDVMWLDIEHTDNKKYFTWDLIKFSNPLEMISNLTTRGRKLVVIVDPHIKRDGGYFLHNDAEQNGYYVKNKDGKDFEGWCWPGSSSYLDFFNPRVSDYYKSRYLFENYKGSTKDVYIWNDMNEPSVFSGPEVTMNKDCVHTGGWEHRDVHNINGFLYTKATYEGLLERSQGRLRPFVLTRAFFAGSQRFTAMWTGDNAAEWSHLRITIPMCLSLSVVGYSNCGADVGGFFKYPDAQLFTRWYQAAVYQPFFRAHSHIDTKRREPWLYDDSTTKLVREAIRERYALLPYWYTLFREHEQTGAPVMRPLWVHYPNDPSTFTIDDEYMLGDALLVHPVLEPDVNSVTVFLPGATEVWYDIHLNTKYPGGSFITYFVDLHTIPVFQRGGTIIPRKDRVRRASTLMHNDPYTLYVALNTNGTATGRLYIDDGESFEYRQGKFLDLIFEFSSNILTSRFANKDAHYTNQAWVERVVIYGTTRPYSKATLTSTHQSDVLLSVNYDNDTQITTVRKPGVNIGQEWTIKLQ